MFSLSEVLEESAGHCNFLYASVHSLCMCQHSSIASRLTKYVQILSHASSSKCLMSLQQHRITIQMLIMRTNIDNCSFVHQCITLVQAGMVFQDKATAEQSQSGLVQILVLCSCYLIFLHFSTSMGNNINISLLYKWRLNEIT